MASGDNYRAGKCFMQHRRPSTSLSVTVSQPVAPGARVCKPESLKHQNHLLFRMPPDRRQPSLVMARPDHKKPFNPVRLDCGELLPSTKLTDTVRCVLCPLCGETIGLIAFATRGARLLRFRSRSGVMSQNCLPLKTNPQYQHRHIYSARYKLQSLPECLQPD